MPVSSATFCTVTEVTVVSRWFFAEPAVQLADLLVENESEDLFSFSGREVSHLKPLSVVKFSLHLHANTFSC